MIRSIYERERRVTIIKLRRYGERERETKIVNEIESYACRWSPVGSGAPSRGVPRMLISSFHMARVLLGGRPRVPEPRGSRGNFKCSPALPCEG